MYGEVLRHHLTTTIIITTMRVIAMIDMTTIQDHPMVVEEEMIMDTNRSNGRRRRSSSSSSSGLSKPKLPSALTGSNRKLGIIFLSSGAVLTVLGITLFFNKTLMRLGNLLFVAGVPLMIGTGRTVGYFLQPKKARATGCLGFGVFLVFVGHPVLGILLEVFGLLNLFGNMFPLVMMMARNVPVLGGLFSGSDKNGSSGRKERRRRESDYDDGYYDDTRYNDDERYREDDIDIK